MPKIQEIQQKAETTNMSESQQNDEVIPSSQNETSKYAKIKTKKTSKTKESTSVQQLEEQLAQYRARLVMMEDVNRDYKHTIQLMKSRYEDNGSPYDTQTHGRSRLNVDNNDHNCHALHKIELMVTTMKMEMENRDIRIQHQMEMNELKMRLQLMEMQRYMDIRNLYKMQEQEVNCSTSSHHNRGQHHQTPNHQEVFNAPWYHQNSVYHNQLQMNRGMLQNQHISMLGMQGTNPHIGIQYQYRSQQPTYRNVVNPMTRPQFVNVLPQPPSYHVTSLAGQPLVYNPQVQHQQEGQQLQSKHYENTNYQNFVSNTRTPKTTHNITTEAHTQRTAPVHNIQHNDGNISMA